MKLLNRRSSASERNARTALKHALKDGTAAHAKPLLLFGQGMPLEIYKPFVAQRRKVLKAHRVTLPEPRTADAVVIIWGLDPAERPTPQRPVFQHINGVSAVVMDSETSYQEAFAMGIPGFLREYGDQGPYKLSTPTLEIYGAQNRRTVVPMTFGLTFPAP